MPGMVSIIFFINLIPLQLDAYLQFRVVLAFIDMPEIIQYMEFNYTQWKIFEEQGIKTLSDIKRKQMSITSSSLSQHMHEEML